MKSQELRKAEVHVNQSLLHFEDSVDHLASKIKLSRDSAIATMNNLRQYRIPILTIAVGILGLYFVRRQLRRQSQNLSK